MGRFGFLIILAIVQGITEFLPVSSSGHLVLIQSLYPGFSQPGALFDAVLHLGTLLAVVVAFRKEVLRLLKVFFGWKKDDPYFRVVWLIVIGSVPAAIVGLTFKDQVEALFNSTVSLVPGWLFTGIILLLSDRFRREKKNIEQITVVDSVIIGIFQALALIPGVSRSGSTIASGIFLGLKGDVAATFSFLLSLPAVGGAGLLELRHAEAIPFSLLLEYLVAGFVAFIVGLLSIKILLRVIEARSLKWFGVYCLVMALIAYLLR